MTNGPVPDGHFGEGREIDGSLSVARRAVRLVLTKPSCSSDKSDREAPMKYALLIYGSRATGDPERELDPQIAAVLERPGVVDWTRLQGVDSATTVRRQDGRRLLTDGPFLDSKEYLGGLVIVDAENLDGALAIVEGLQDARPHVAIEVRPVLETP